MVLASHRVDRDHSVSGNAADCWYRRTRGWLRRFRSRFDLELRLCIAAAGALAFAMMDESGYVRRLHRGADQPFDTVLRLAAVSPEVADAKATEDTIQAIEDAA
jgi:hypothetical protein